MSIRGMGLLAALGALLSGNAPHPKMTVGSPRKAPRGQRIGKHAMGRKRDDGSIEVVNPLRRERKAMGLSGRQWRKWRKAQRRTA